MKHLFFYGIFILGLSGTACKDKSQPANINEPVATPENKPQSQTKFDFQIAPNQSSLKWSGSKPTGTHSGLIPISNGGINVENGVIKGGSIELDMTKLIVQDPTGDMGASLEAHLRGTAPGKEEDFFNVNKYPKATYTITSITPLANDPDATHMINGNLTIKDITKPVNFKAKIEMKENIITAIAAPFDIDRTEFDIRFKSKKFFDNLKDDYVNDIFQIGFSIVAIKNP